MHTDQTIVTNRIHPLMISKPYPFFFKGCLIATPISLVLWWGIIKLALALAGY